MENIKVQIPLSHFSNVDLTTVTPTLAVWARKDFDIILKVYMNDVQLEGQPLNIQRWLAAFYGQVE